MNTYFRSTNTFTRTILVTKKLAIPFVVLAAMVSLIVGTASSASAATGAADRQGGAAQALAETCVNVPVSFRGIQRGYLYGCFTAYKDSIGPWVEGEFRVCDIEDEPAETNIVRAQVVAAFSNGSSWQYPTQGWFLAFGDGLGCNYYGYFQDGPHNTAWNAEYMKLTVQAPGKAENVQRPGL